MIPYTKEGRIPSSFGFALGCIRHGPYRMVHPYGMDPNGTTKFLTLVIFDPKDFIFIAFTIRTNLIDYDFIY